MALRIRTGTKNQRLNWTDQRVQNWLFVKPAQMSTLAVQFRHTGEGRCPSEARWIPTEVYPELAEGSE